MIDPRRALVRPRVRLAGEAAAVRLDEEIAGLLDAGEHGAIELVGPPGSGKTTALAHLADVFGDEPALLLADRPDAGECEALTFAAADHLIVYVRSAAATRIEVVCRKLQLAPWGEDDWIEYLLAAHRERCASVIGRARRDPQMKRLAGSPLLCRTVLDVLAAEETIVDAPSALRRELSRRLGSAYGDAGFWCWDRISTTEQAIAPEPSEHRSLIGKGVFGLLRHHQVRTLLAADHLCARLQYDAALTILCEALPEALVKEAGSRLRNVEPILSRLRNVAGGGPEQQQSMAASLLHAAGDPWIPAPGRAPLLKGAYLSGVRWPGIKLRSLNIEGADLSFADLHEAHLTRSSAAGAKLTGIHLHGALLKKMVACGADLSGADLSLVRALAANLSGADLRDADLQGALLRRADLDSADLREARLCRANLSFAWLQHCRIEGADFTGADLSGTDLCGLTLHTAEFVGACFEHEFLNDCNLENMILPGANFFCARMRDAHLTGSQMPHAKLERADLFGAGLAEIEWEHADLRNADLRGSTFHMGSSRSGLVGSPFVSEGTRTGFYTDEYGEQEFKAPEEIRKANLCFADLRGAQIDDVDFYLVDLRGARYTTEQEQHFRRCGAILESRV